MEGNNNAGINIVAENKEGFSIAIEMAKANDVDVIIGTALQEKDFLQGRESKLFSAFPVHRL